MLLSPSLHRKAARESLVAAHKPGRVILIHTGVVMLAMLLSVLIDHLLDQQIATTGGISGMGTRSVLMTAQSVLRILQMILLPFWQVGYTYYTLRIARTQKAGPRDLLEGFRRFFPILRLKLLIGGMLFLLVFACSYGATFLFMVTPWAAPMLAETEAMLLEGISYIELSERLMAQMQDSIALLMTLFGILFAAGGIALFFLYRQAELWLLDHPDKGAFAALRGSRQCMRGNKKGMLRVDLSFWWFYVLELLVLILSFGDVILEAFGMVMTTDTFVSYLIFFCLYLWAQLMLYCWKRNEVAVTYAHAYLALCPEEAAKEQTTAV